MAINLYSKDSIDNLLSAKLSISSLTNAATSTLNATAPTTGQALTFDGTDLVWATVGGGGGSASWGSITGTLSSQTDLNTALGNKADLNAPSFTGGITADGGVTVPGPSGNSTFTYGGLNLGPSSSGITFADSTVQTTAAVAPPNANVLTANAIASNINYLSGSSGTWVNNPPSVASLVSWGIYNVSDGYLSYSYSSGSTFYLSGSVTTSNNTVQISGNDSSFYVA